MLDPAVMAALACPERPQELEWLQYPQTHFAPVRDGDLVDDGVCVLFIATKLCVAQPAATCRRSPARAGHLQADQPVDLIQA